MLGIEVGGEVLARLIAVRRGSVAEDLDLEVSRVGAVDAQRHLSGGDTVTLELANGRGVVNGLGVPGFNLVSARI